MSEKLFNKVQKKIKDDTKPGTNSPRSKTSPNPLSELIKCVNCSDGSDEPHPNMVMMNGRHEKELTCSAKKNSGVKYCQTPNIPMEPFLNLIVSALLDSALTEHVMQEQIQIIIDNNQQLVAEERERQAGIKKRISDIKTQEDNLLMSLRDREASHPIATDLLMNDLEKLGQERIEYESQSRNLDDDVAETIAFATEPETIIKAALDLRTYLEATDKSAAKTFLRGLIKRVDVAHDTATIHYGLPMPNAQETEHGYTTTVSLDDLEDGPKLLLEHGSPLPCSKRITFECTVPLPTKPARKPKDPKPNAIVTKPNTSKKPPRTPTPLELTDRRQKRREYDKIRSQRPERLQSARDRQKKLRQKAKELGICCACSQPPIPGQTRCPSCAAKHRQ